MTVKCWRIPTSKEEVVEVYFEEVGELLERLDDNIKAWTQHPEDKKTLTEIRRVFHTLKGSGRMANVLDVSELAWRVENMLNQAIAGAVPVSEPMMKLVASARAQIPKMVDALKNGRSLTRNDEISKLIKIADILASERRSTQIAAQLSVTSKGAKPSSELYELNLKLDRCMQRADEALRRSEMALHYARSTTSLPDASPDLTTDYGRTELNRGRFGWPALVFSALLGGVMAALLLVLIL